MYCKDSDIEKKGRTANTWFVASGADVLKWAFVPSWSFGSNLKVSTFEFPAWRKPWNRYGQAAKCDTAKKDEQ